MMRMNMKDSKLPLKNKISKKIAGLPKSGIRDFFELVNTMDDDVISLGIGEPDFVTPWHIRESTIYSLERGHTGYTSNLGLLSLRKAVIKYIEQKEALTYSPSSECIITVGVSEALDILMRAIINPGDEVIYHEPCYVSYSPEIIMADGIPVPVVTKEKNSFSLDPHDVEKAITPHTKAILLNFPCNPTGATLTLEQKKKIAEIAVENNLIVISDEIYSELTYENRTPSIASFPGMKERTVILNGFSKAFAMTGFRLGYACGPEPVIDAMMKVHQYSMLCASIIAQEAAEEALLNGKSEMLKMRTEYNERRNVIVKKLNDMGLECFKPEGSFYVFPNIKKSGLSSKEFASRLLVEGKVAVVPGDAFGSCGEGFVRCAYAASMEDINTAMERTGSFIKKL
jgi:aminotransferase